MRLLLDECLPKDLAREFPGHSAKTVPQMGWATIKNGALLRLIASTAKFDVFITVDKNLSRQNKIQTVPFGVIVLRAKSNRLVHLLPLVPAILRRLPEIRPGRVVVFTE